MKALYPWLKAVLVIVFLCFSLMGYAQRFLIPQQEEEYIPIPQVATETNYDKETGFGGAINEIWTYEIPWSWKELRRHFTDKMPDYGWIVDPGDVSYGEFFDKNSVVFNKDNKSLMITNISTSPSQGQIVFSVRLSEMPSAQETDTKELTGLPQFGATFDPSQDIAVFLESKPFTDMVRDIPIYPGASQIMAKKQANMIMGVFASSANKESIITFYNSAMMQKRWSLGYDIDLKELKRGVGVVPMPSAEECPDCSQSPDFMAMLGDIDVYTMQFRKGERQCTINLVSLGISGTTMITINYFETAN